VRLVFEKTARRGERERTRTKNATLDYRETIKGKGEPNMQYYYSVIHTIIVNKSRGNFRGFTYQDNRESLMIERWENRENWFRTDYRS